MLKAAIIGNLGADAEIAQNNTGRYLKLRVAHSRKYPDKDGVLVTETIWVSCMWSRYNENVVPYLRKGSQVYVWGNLSSRVYMGSDGHHHAGLTIQVHDLELCGSKPAEEGKEE